MMQLFRAGRDFKIDVGNKDFSDVSSGSRFGKVKTDAGLIFDLATVRVIVNLNDKIGIGRQRTPRSGRQFAWQSAGPPASE